MSQMGFHWNKHSSMAISITVVFLLLCCSQQVLGIRPLQGEEWPEKNLLLGSLHRGPVPPSTGSACTYIPGLGRGRCTLSEMNVAGHPAHAQPYLPHVDMDIAAASAS